MKHKASISHDEAIVKELRERPDFAAEYLKAALEDTEEPGVLLVALRRVAKARGGVAKVAKAAGVERESLYRALSARGNPRWRVAQSWRCSNSGAFIPLPKICGMTPEF
jgi:probable addiction module antidote protein